jgi:hypothetical protein
MNINSMDAAHFEALLSRSSAKENHEYLGWKKIEGKTYIHNFKDLKSLKKSGYKKMSLASIENVAKYVLREKATDEVKKNITSAIWQMKQIRDVKIQKANSRLNKLKYVLFLTVLGIPLAFMISKKQQRMLKTSSDLSRGQLNPMLRAYIDFVKESISELKESFSDTAFQLEGFRNLMKEKGNTERMLAQFKKDHERNFAFTIHDGESDHVSHPYSMLLARRKEKDLELQDESHMKAMPKSAEDHVRQQLEAIESFCKTPEEITKWSKIIQAGATQGFLADLLHLALPIKRLLAEDPNRFSFLDELGHQHQYTLETNPDFNYSKIDLQRDPISGNIIKVHFEILTPLTILEKLGKKTTEGVYQGGFKLSFTISLDEANEIQMSDFERNFEFD